MGNPGVFYRSCSLLPLQSGSTPAPRTRHHHPPHTHTTFCVHDLNIGSVLIRTGMCFNVCPAILTHTQARVSSQSLLHLKSIPSHLRPAPGRGILSPPLPKAQATSFGAQLPGTHSFSEQGAPPSLQLQGLCLQGRALGLKGHANTTS